MVRLVNQLSSQNNETNPRRWPATPTQRTAPSRSKEAEEKAMQTQRATRGQTTMSSGTKEADLNQKH